jgi:hypothetical protein
MLTWEESAVPGQPHAGALAHYQIIRRHVAVVPFEPNKIARALMRAFMAVRGVLAFAQDICSGWLHGLWRAIKPLKGCANGVDRAAGLDRSCMVPQQGRSKQQRFFGSNKPDMRNAP